MISHSYVNVYQRVTMNLMELSEPTMGKSLDV